MNKTIITLTLFFIASFSSLFGERLGAFSIYEGRPMPFNQGVVFECGDSGFIQVFILDHQFTAVFLDSQKNVWVPEDVVQVILLVQSVQGDGESYPYHLKRSEGWLFHSNSRYVYEPHQYNVEVIVEKKKGKFPHSRARKFTYPHIRETYGVQLLSQ